MNIAELEEQLLAVADFHQVQPMRAYMKNNFDFLGVRTPDRRKVTRELFKKSKSQGIDWDFVEACWDKPYREFQYVAIDYLVIKKKDLALKDLPRLKKLAQTKSWWDSIDGLDELVGKIVLNHPEAKTVILDWSVDDDFWLRRLAIDHQLLEKENTDTELLEQILVNNLNQTEFFINKAIGWSLRYYSKTNPEWVRMFINKYRNQMASLSIREASKYI
ncbi:DNA alkylation repair protein [Streptococcus ruminantium]|uniref:DNA alkylation repair protein n=3 Tax=Streptococcus ruminantium TaxID=1917441 RepID=A0ABU1B392_9STRE|nr:DNA alkylation repair protein [Streptococcus ruminantium]MDQ8758528.1 DNA alkylation repair protein [Streptococcus ruminantium]MDQ8768111.1 DNA alkylation repair protein [Streptococcus ruminantium]MDQ8773992.1 DNA alkylation repair protein [Streptococcus ruminantium]MDQ8794232.1 DNA alkylation repair protein [Streptococcus ruminantium]MDQ8806291.1 DNA alkylation repair protein [Streptococcus ruminantium]